jgi:hypothetical protein
MGKSTYRLIGIYKIVPTKESIIEAARYHECDYLLDADGNFVDEIHWENHKNLALLEFQVTGSFTPNDLMKIRQGDQAPYMEYYLDPRGEKCVDENQAIRRDGRRACFFMHFLNTRKPLMVDNLEIVLTAMQELLERLMPFTHYLPVD